MTRRKREHLRFGAFSAPFHLPIGRNPNLLVHRDIELAVHLDKLGYDELWMGEHHSIGAETIGDPLLFLSHVAARTTNIRLGSGVVSLPYHNPLLLADRFSLLDHITRGRVILGLGPGALTTDAHMIGLDQETQREAFEEDMQVLMDLLNGEWVTAKTPRYTLNDAHLHLTPYSDIEVAVAGTATPTGPRIAGQHGLGLLTLGATSIARKSDDALSAAWDTCVARAATCGQVPPDRSGWRLVGYMHVAETEEQARRDVRHGIDAFFDYLQYTQASAYYGSMDISTTEERIQFVIDSGMGVIGTPEQVVAQIEHIREQTRGGFGAFLLGHHEWADWPQTLRSYDLFAEHVMPHFQGQLEAPLRSKAFSEARRDELSAGQRISIERALRKTADQP